MTPPLLLAVNQLLGVWKVNAVETTIQTTQQQQPTTLARGRVELRGRERISSRGSSLRGKGWKLSGERMGEHSSNGGVGAYLLEQGSSTHCDTMWLNSVILQKVTGLLWRTIFLLQTSTDRHLCTFQKVTMSLGKLVGGVAALPDEVCLTNNSFSIFQNQTFFGSRQSEEYRQ